jgi:protein-tyrosine sulfotransferase
LIKPIFLLGSHKSGTSLLRALFDNHSQVFSIPIETHFAHFLGWWTRYPFLRTKKKNYSLEEFENNASKWIHTCNTSNDPYGDSQASGLFDETLFKEEMGKLNSNSSEMTKIDQYFRSIYSVINKKAAPEDLRFIEKTVENSEHAIRIASLYPDAKFIHILRNPYANLVTLRRYLQKMKKSYPHLDSLIKSIYDSFYFADFNSTNIENYKIIYYKDLVTNPQKIMKDLALFVEIDFEENLLTPSYLGSSWGGNSVSGNKFKGVSSARINAWKKDINSLEIEVVNAVMGVAIERNDYKKIKAKNRILIPQKREYFRAYLGNRILLKRPF